MTCLGTFPLGFILYGSGAKPFWHQQLVSWKTIWSGGWGVISRWFKHITFIVHLISINTTSVLPQIIRHSIPEVGDPHCVDPLCFLDLGDCFLSPVRKGFNYSLLKCFLRPFLVFWDPYNVNVGMCNAIPEVSEIFLISFFLCSVLWQWFLPLCLLADSFVLLQLFCYWFLLLYFFHCNYCVVHLCSLNLLSLS